MNRLALAFVSSLALAASACTWVKPTAGAESVRVAYDGNVSGCRDVGAISVSVADKVGLYTRSELKVRDELETLARNQAAEIPADTIKPSGDPHDGEQKFQAYVCGRAAARARPVRDRDDEAQTHAIKD